MGKEAGRGRRDRPGAPDARGPSARAQNGFSLIEALVALVVLSVGMIGVAAMYGQGLAATRSAQLRTQAVNLAADMADRIRVNRLGGAAYAGAAADRGCGPGGGTCAPAEMAAHDLFVWESQAAELLPNGSTEVLYDGGTTPPTYTVRVSWDEVGEGVVQHEVVVQVPTF
ncbi:MAG: type IV pilus modification protein PilV [Gammaproteobacteria bacterium]|nr:type IV pilus modification protein PilV [Gammaproteobacteria bacterium]